MKPHTLPQPQLPTEADPSIQVTADKSRRLIAASVYVQCTPATLYRIWADVANWHVWDPATKAASLSSPFAPGAVGKITPAKGMALPLRITQADPSTGFVAECPVLGSRMVFHHHFRATPQGLLATHELQFTGLLATPLYKLVANDVTSTLALTLTRLRALCEGDERT